MFGIYFAGGGVIAVVVVIYNYVHAYDFAYAYNLGVDIYVSVSLNNFSRICFCTLLFVITHPPHPNKLAYKRMHSRDFPGICHRICGTAARRQYVGNRGDRRFRS